MHAKLPKKPNGVVLSKIHIPEDNGASGIAPIANAAPISDGEMAIAVLHGMPKFLNRRVAFWPKMGSRCGFV